MCIRVIGWRCDQFLHTGFSAVFYILFRIDECATKRQAFHKCNIPIIRYQIQLVDAFTHIQSEAVWDSGATLGWVDKIAWDGKCCWCFWFCCFPLRNYCCVNVGISLKFKIYYGMMRCQKISNPLVFVFIHYEGMEIWSRALHICIHIGMYIWHFQLLLWM